MGALEAMVLAKERRDHVRALLVEFLRGVSPMSSELAALLRADDLATQDLEAELKALAHFNSNRDRATHEH